MTHDILQTLKKARLKTTPARKLILDIFSADCKPINAEFIYDKLKTKNIHQVTIYRTLASFERTGVIKKVDLRKGSVHYELTSHHHHHVVCTNCGKTEGFEMCDVEKISKDVLKKSLLFEVVNQHSLELFGLCKSCSKK